MFRFECEKISEGQVHRYSVYKSDIALRFIDVLDAWQHDHDFQQFYNSILSNSPFEAFFWEHPPITRSYMLNKYEFVLVNSTRLASVQVEPTVFKTHFSSGGLIVHFINLGGDAELIVPSPQHDTNDYRHLAAFCRIKAIRTTIWILENRRRTDNEKIKY